MFYIFSLGVVAACVAGSAAFFSVYGLGHTFSGAFWTVVFMGGSLEAGKLMTASFLYRYSAHIGWRMKIPAYAFILALMGVTSVGIYGYLSAAYQSDTVTLKQIRADVELKQKELSILQKRKETIDLQVAQLPANVVKGRQKLLAQFKNESDAVMSRINALTQDIQSLTQRKITSESHVGPIMFIAEVCNVSPDKAINVLMLVIIFAFDPLAILLTIAVNVAIKVRSEAKKAEENNVRTYEPAADDAQTKSLPQGENDVRESLLTEASTDSSDLELAHETKVVEPAHEVVSTLEIKEVEEPVLHDTTQSNVEQKLAHETQSPDVFSFDNIDDIDLIALDDYERSLNKEPHFYYTSPQLPRGHSKSDIVADFRRL